MSHDRERDLANAAALGNALLAFLVVPWTLTLLLYTGGHGWCLRDYAHRALGKQAGLSGVRRSTLAGGHAGRQSNLQGLNACVCAGLHWTYPADKAEALRQLRHSLRYSRRWILWHCLVSCRGAAAAIATCQAELRMGAGLICRLVDACRERCAGLEEQGILIDRLSSTISLSPSNASIIELPASPLVDSTAAAAGREERSGLLTRSVEEGGSHIGSGGGGSSDGRQ